MIKDAGWASLYIKEHGSIVFLGAPYRCGTLTHDNMDTALHGAVRGSIPEITDLNWRGDVTWTTGGTAIIRGEKGDLEPNEGD